MVVANRPVPVPCPRIEALSIGEPLQFAFTYAKPSRQFSHRLDFRNRPVSRSIRGSIRAGSAIQCAIRSLPLYLRSASRRPSSVRRKLSTSCAGAAPASRTCSHIFVQAHLPNAIAYPALRVHGQQWNPPPLPGENRLRYRGIEGRIQHREKPAGCSNESDPARADLRSAQGRSRDELPVIHVPLGIPRESPDQARRLGSCPAWSIPPEAE